jgi:hypothetical protein
MVAGSRAPLVLIVAPARPQVFLREGLLEPDPDVTGLYRGLGEYAELRYLWVYGLDPDEAGWDLVRWGYPPHPRRSVDRMRFFSNPAVPIAHKQKLWSLLMSGQYALELEPDENPYDIVLEKGREQGLERGFHALLFVARKVLTAREVEQFENRPVSEELVDELRQVIAQRLPADGRD